MLISAAQLQAGLKDAAAMIAQVWMKSEKSLERDIWVKHY